MVDVAWSPCDTMLASCGMDNNVIVWARAGGAQLRVLQGHTSLVKGAPLLEVV